MTKQELVLWKQAEIILSGLDKALERDGGEDLNDSLLSQIWGMDEQVYRLRTEISHGLDDHSIKTWTESLDEDWQMVKQIRAYQDWKGKEPTIDWIYA